MSEFLFFIIGTMLGGLFGVACMCCLQISRLSERKEVDNAKKKCADNLNGTADVKATFTAEGRKKNCIIKLEEIEKISSVHREKNEDNAHFIKNPHIFTYLHRLQSQRRTNNQSLILGNPNF